MANAVRGEVSIEVEGRPYTLRPSINAMCELEEQFGMTIDEIGAEASKGKLRVIRAMVWAYLQERHAEEFPDYKAVGAWMSKLPLDEVTKAFAAMQALNAPPATEAPTPAKGSGTSRPPEARIASTGEASVLTPVATV